jgi:hypothetical protein
MVTLALIPHLPKFIGKVWEPACGSGKMAECYFYYGQAIESTDTAEH